jgi:hypothetical protein
MKRGGVVSVLYTSGDDLFWETYADAGTNLAGAERARVQCQVERVAVLVHTLDRRPRRTFIFHEPVRV